MREDGGDFGWRRAVVHGAIDPATLKGCKRVTTSCSPLCVWRFIEVPLADSAMEKHLLIFLKGEELLCVKMVAILDGGGLWFMVLLILQLSKGVKGSPQVAALYVFGDSLVDDGNNNNLNSMAKANYFPYGCDFDRGATGRFSNGKTFADFLGNFLSQLISHHAAHI
ncbi:unnamed protein product [Ilex paraguariensis]|uniref:GDSL esterase/lipase n=1 Tax=Ilex paraguariensis TaxID=185542 RepID=A0ABC8SVH3_9AQUA